MNKDKTDKKTAAGCLLIAAFFFFFLAIYQCSEERQEKQTKQEIRYSAPAPYGSDKPTHTKRVPLAHMPQQQKQTPMVTLMIIPTLTTLSLERNMTRNL